MTTINLPVKPWPSHVSHSQFQLAKQCPMAYHLKYRHGLAEEETEAMRLGSKIHAIMEAFHWGGNPGKPDELTDAEWSGVLEYRPDPARRVHGAAFHEQEYRAFDSYSGMVIIGRVDRVELSIYDDGGDYVEIIDYKCGRAFPTSEQRDLENDAQMLLYMQLVNAPMRFEVYRVRLTKIWPMLDFSCSLDIEHDFKQINRCAEVLVPLMKNVMAVRESDPDPTPGPHCANCSFKAHCPEFAKDVVLASPTLPVIGSADEAFRAYDLIRDYQAKADYVEAQRKAFVKANGGRVEHEGRVMEIKEVPRRTPVVRSVAALAKKYGIPTDAVMGSLTMTATAMDGLARMIDDKDKRKAFKADLNELAVTYGSSERLEVKP